MNKLSIIKKPILQYLDDFDSQFEETLKSDIKLINTIYKFVKTTKGKQIRPIFVFLSAQLCGGINNTTQKSALLIEILHSATLIHDDIVDDSDKRRGFFSINALWKNKAAVLLGDHLLTKGIEIAVNENLIDLLKIALNTSNQMIEGEFLQLEKTRLLNIKEEEYFEIIKKKTAVLLSSCCEAGAMSVTSDREVIEKMRLFGEYVGMAFQIKDDLLDYENSSASGKPNGADIKEKKLTLPLIYLLNNSSLIERRKILNIIQFNNKNSEKIKSLIDKVNQSKGIEYSEKIMNEFQQKALDILKTFPESEVRNSLSELVTFTTSRNY